MKKRNIRTTKTTGSRRGMGRVAPSMGDILKMKYTFQMLAADYFHHMGQYYAVIVDRYSH